MLMDYPAFLFEYQITDLTILPTVKFYVTFSGLNPGNFSCKHSL